jgi:superfamily II DNA or RNA helicase
VKKNTTKTKHSTWDKNRTKTGQNGQNGGFMHTGIITDRDCWERIGITPRQWQREAFCCAMDSIRKREASLIQAVMGAGKSYLLVAIVAQSLQDGANCVVVTTPRAKLVSQLYKDLVAFLGPIVGRYDGVKKEPTRKVIVACDASTKRLAHTLQQEQRKVDLWIADEAHGSEAQRMKLWNDLSKPVARLGLTATPQRGKKGEALSLWNKEIYRYDASRALKEGVVVPFYIRHWTGEKTNLDEAIIEMIKEVVHVGPGIVDARSISDANDFCSQLRNSGVTADVIHSKMTNEQISLNLEKLRTGKIEALVHISLLKEGVNLPWLRWLALRRQVASKVYFAQHVGRVLRAHPGKEFAYILDPGDLFERHELNLEAILECSVEENIKIRVGEGGRNQGNAKNTFHEPVYTADLSDDTSELRKIIVYMKLNGEGDFKDLFWRHEKSTHKQINLIEYLARQETVKANLQARKDVELLRRIYAQRKNLTKGEASDFISILQFYKKKHTKH